MDVTASAQALSSRIRRRPGTTLSVAESCTGGLLGGAITAIAGSSDFFLGGVIAYSNSVKVALLRVDPDDLARFGAVSREIAASMASGVRAITGSRLSISITGIAGPGGAREHKPVGLVYIAVSTEATAIVEEHHLAGTREQIRLQAVAQGCRAAIRVLDTLQ